MTLLYIYLIGAVIFGVVCMMLDTYDELSWPGIITTALLWPVFLPALLLATLFLAKILRK